MQGLLPGYVFSSCLLFPWLKFSRVSNGDDVNEWTDWVTDPFSDDDKQNTFNTGGDKGHGRRNVVCKQTCTVLLSK